MKGVLVHTKEDNFEIIIFSPLNTNTILIHDFFNHVDFNTTFCFLCRVMQRKCTKGYPI